MLEQIAGDKYDIRCLLTTGGDPESYDPSFTNLLNTRNSVAYLTMGDIGFEKAVVGKIKNENPDLPVFNIGKGIVAITGTHAPGEVDPHTWSSVKNARVIADNMAQAMISIDPKNAKFFRKNLKHFLMQLDSLDTEIRLKLGPKAGLPFLVWHPSLSYFARDYNLRQIAIGGDEHKDVSIPELKKNISEAINSGAKVLFIQKDIDSRQTESANEQIGARLVEIHPLDYDWPNQMRIIADAIAQP